MSRCHSTRPVSSPVNTGLRCTREVPHAIHANCGLWWDDAGNHGTQPGWPREAVPLFPVQ